jgi:MFS family permease
MQEIENPSWRQAINGTVIVAGLGYFVDLFDITLFGVVRVASLNGIGITDPDEVLRSGVYIYNAGLIGMVLGGLFWGVLADKIGRISVLFGSILIYSLGSIASAFAWDADSYALIRFITGIGLAGELGAAVTLVAESLPQKLRGVGTTIVATMGLSGSIAAGWVGQHLHWQHSYILGGVMGLALLVARLKMFESGMFNKLVQNSKASRGDLRLLLNPARFRRYIACILLGAPIYFITGILLTFSPEITKGLGVEGVIAGKAILYGSIGLAIGDLLAGLLSQVLQSRKKAVATCIILAAGFATVYLTRTDVSPEFIYKLCFLAGTAAGYWAVLITMAAEQFGTNIRGTVATSIPNFVRGTAVISVGSFSLLKPSLGVAQAAGLVGAIVFSLALISLYSLKETFSTDLDFTES